MNIDIKILKEILANQNTATHKQRYIPQEVCTRCKYIWDLSQKCKVVSKYKYQSMYYIILIEQETKITWSSQKMQKKIFDKTQHPLMLKMPDKWRNIIVMFFDLFFLCFSTLLTRSRLLGISSKALHIVVSMYLLIYHWLTLKALHPRVLPFRPHGFLRQLSPCPTVPSPPRTCTYAVGDRSNLALRFKN